MIERLRQFLATGPGKAIAIAVVVLLVGMAMYEVRATFGDSPAAATSSRRTFVCSETGRSFEVDLRAGMTLPAKSPYTGRATGYEFDEVCAWTADGRVADKPTYVLLNKTLKRNGPTFCPVCGRLVVENNPPAEGDKPPPTKAEYDRGKR